MKLKESFEIIDIGDETIITPIGEEMQAFNGVAITSDAAAFIIKQLRNDRTIDELQELLEREFDISSSSARRDILIFIDEIRDMGLLE